MLIYSAGLAELIDERIVTPQIFTGLRDTVEVLQRLAVKNSALARIDAELAKAPAEFGVDPGERGILHLSPSSPANEINSLQDYRLRLCKWISYW